MNRRTLLAGSALALALPSAPLRAAGPAREISISEALAKALRKPLEGYMQRELACSSAASAGATHAERRAVMRFTALHEPAMTALEACFSGDPGARDAYLACRSGAVRFQLDNFGRYFLTVQDILRWPERAAKFPFSTYEVRVLDLTLAALRPLIPKERIPAWDESGKRFVTCAINGLAVVGMLCRGHGVSEAERRKLVETQLVTTEILRMQTLLHVAVWYQCPGRTFQEALAVVQNRMREANFDAKKLSDDERNAVIDRMLARIG